MIARTAARLREEGPSRDAEELARLLYVIAIESIRGAKCLGSPHTDGISAKTKGTLCSLGYSLETPNPGEEASYSVKVHW
jgi:hypothetical protein